MERTASRPPPGGGANWAVFFAPLGVTGVVILGALVFVWTSEPEPVDRPEVERVDLSERDPVPDSTRLSSIPTTRQFDGVVEEAATRLVRAPEAARELTPSGSDAAPEVDDDYEDDEDFVDMTSDREYTPEERREAKAGLMDAVRKVPFMAPMMKNLEPKEAATEVGAESAAQDGAPTSQEAPAPPGAAGAAAQ